jgi:hypothetical protein
VWAELGKTWQPFGGAGYFVIVALLALATLLAACLITLPIVVRGFAGRASRAAARQTPPVFGRALYFGLVGLAYLLVEIPFIQRFILFLGHPAYAITAVLFALLLFSGIGSHWGERIALRAALGALVALLAAGLWGMPALLKLALGLPLALRLGLTLLMLAPLGFLMGIPLPGGIRRLSGDEERATQIPWLWAVNGSASVIAAVLAALLALTFGFNAVLAMGTACYAGAWLIAATAWRGRPAACPAQ